MMSNLCEHHNNNTQSSESESEELREPGGYSLIFGGVEYKIPVESLFNPTTKQNWVPICDNDFHLNSDDPCSDCDKQKRSGTTVSNCGSYLDTDLHFTSDHRLHTESGFACPHRGCFSVCASYRFCGFCLFLFNLDKFFKKNKYLSTRRSISRLAHCSAEDLLSLSILFSSNCVVDAEVVANNRVSCQYVELLSPNVRISLKTSFASCDWIMCDNVKHLFECLSISDASGGHIVGHDDKNAYWNASCSRCNACCQGTNARSAIPVILLLRFITIRKEGITWIASHMHDADDFVEINDMTANFIGKVNGFSHTEAFEGSNMKVDLQNMISCDQHKLVSSNWKVKYPRVDPLCSEPCDHTFVIRNQYGVEIPLSDSMLLTFLLLISNNGLLFSEDEEHNALVSFGGMIGVNVMCNREFAEIHKRFYSGNHRTPPALLVSSERLVNSKAHSGFNDEEFHRLMNEENDVEVQSVSNWVSDYLETEDVIDIIDEAESSKIRGLGLNQVLGGLLKGVSHCVDSLHKVFDWPIDLAIDAAKGTAAWLEDNKSAVDDSKICAGCPEIQKDMQDFQKETKIGMELLRDSIKKLSEGIDRITNMNQTNFERIVNRLKPIESKLKELEKFKEDASNQKDGEAMKQLVQAIKDIKIIKEAMLNLNERVKDLESGKSGQVIVEKPDDDLAGEQKPIPKVNKIRLKAIPVKKQSGTTIVNNDIEQQFKDEEKSMVDPNLSDMMNAVKSEYLVKSFTWKVSDGQDKVLADINIPEDLWSTNSRLNDIMGYFQYYKAAGLTFRISTTCIPMHGGTLFAAWDACGCATRQGIATAVQLTGLPGIMIEAHSSSLTKFSVEDPLTQSTVCLSGSEHSFGRIGILKICCLNVLNAPQAATQSVSVNVWVKLDGVKFHFYSLKKQPAVSQMFVDKLTDLGELGCVVATGTWSTTSKINLLELNVHPTACSIVDGLITQTPLSVVAHAFARWRGTLKFTITFGASMFTRGRVLVAAVPVAKRKDTLTMEEICGYHNVMCLLNGEKTSFELEVPYYSIGEDSFVCRDALFDVSSYAQNFMITRLHFVVIDTLVMSANASNSISFSVMMGPGKDLEFRNLSGVHAQRNVRELVAEVSLGFSLHSGKNIGQGFSDMLKRWSHLLTLTFNESAEDSEKRIGSYIITVAPSYRSFPQHNTLLSWFSQLFVQWQGGLCYRLHVDSQERRYGGFIRIWHDPNGSLDEGVEFAITNNAEPPPGAYVRYWNYNEQNEYEFVVPYTARTSRLFVPKAMIPTDAKSWILNYNGTLNLDYRGIDDFNVSVDICAADNFEFSVRTVAPRAGKVNESFTKLSYNKDLVDIKKPLTAAGRLKGPFNLNTIKTAKPAKTPEENSSTQQANKAKHSTPSERKGAFEALANSVAQMQTLECDAHGCLTLGGVKQTMKLFKQRQTCDKLADILDFTHGALGVGDQPAAQRLAAAVAQIAPIIESVGRTTASVETKLHSLDKYKGKIMNVLEALSSESIPGLAIAEFKKGKYMWASFLTLIAGAALSWACVSKKSFLKRFSVVVMIIWSPFLAGKVWSLGQWIVHKWSQLWPKSDSCRQHSLAGLFENAKTKIQEFPEWFTSGGMSIVSQVCTVLLTIVSLITLGTIPSAKKSKTLAERFMDFGNMNRAATSIVSGYKSISEMCAKFSNFITVQFFGDTIDDGVFKDLVSFDVKKWVQEVKEMSLEENKFKAFGTDKQLSKVRHVYDKSVVITQQLLDRNKVPVGMLPIIRDTCKKCEELLNDSYSYKGMKTPRVDPFYICLTGPPGVGKSTVASIIINDLLDHMGEPRVDRIYTRCCADAYWSNYHHEPVIIYDDLGAISKVASLSDYAEIMGIKSNRPYSLPMAAVEEKGRHCLSKYLVACTNLTHLDDTGDVKTKDAYYRRINLPVTVERDNSSPMNPEDPSSGLMFTIGDVFENGRYTSVVESRLLKDRVPFRAGDLRNMNYNYFMEFVRIYATIYMENQELLVAKLSGTDYEPRSGGSSSEEDELEFNFLAQAHGMVSVTVKEIIQKFDSLKLQGKEMNAEVERLGRPGIDGWRTKKVLSFDELVRRFCGCNTGDDCNFEFHYQSLYRELNANKRVPAYKCMVLGKANKDRYETTVKLVNGHSLESMFKTLDTVTIFLYLVFLIKIGFNSDTVCLSYQLTSDDEIQEIEPDVDDALDVRAKVQIGDLVCYVWPSIVEYFPDIVAKRGCLAVNDGKQFHVFVTDPQQSTIDAPGAWSDLLQGIGKKSTNILYLASPQKHKLLSAFVKNCHTALMEPTKWAACCEEYKNCLTELEYMYLLIATGIRAGVHTKKSNKVQAKKNGVNMLNVAERFTKMEYEMLENLSKPAKTCLAIGAGVAIFGVLAGIGYGLYKVISQFTKKEERDDEGFEFDELVPEMSGAHESSGITTRHVVHRVKLPTVRIAKQKGRSARSSSCSSPRSVDTDDLVKEMSGCHVSDENLTAHLTKKRISHRLKPEMSGCHASDENVTKYFTRRRVPMKRTTENLVKENYVVQYDERTPYTTIIRNIRRSRLARAIKQMANQESFPDTMEEIQAWQKFVADKGVRPSNHVTDFRVFSAIAQDEVEDPENINMSSGDTMTFDERKYSEVSNVIKSIVPGKNELKQMTEKGAHHTAVKQVRLNYKSLEKDPNMVSLLSNQLAKISCVVVNMTPGRVAYLNVMRLCGTFVVCPAHYLEALEEDDELYFISFSICIKFRFQADRVTLVNTHQDLIVWDLGNTIPPAINVIDMVPTVADWDRYQDGPGAFGVTKYNAKWPTNYINTLDMIERIRADTQNPTGIYKMLNSDHTITTGLRYQMYSLEGFCGGLIIRASTRMVRKIVGLHVAASSNHAMGYAECLVQEDLRSAVARLAPDARNTVLGHLAPKIDVATMQCGLERSLGSLGCHGVVGSEDVALTSTKTTVRPSRIHGLVGEIRTEPSILHSQDPRLPRELRGKWDPIFEAALKYGTRIDPFPHDEIVEVEEHLTNMLKNMENSLTKRNVNSLEIGINGIDRSDYWLQIEFNTSPGWPYTKRKPKGAEGKKWLFKEVGTYPSGKSIFDFEDPGLIESYNQMLSDAKLGIAPTVVTVECAKDERRKLSKIYESPATRTFTILPPEINILFRQYFGDFAAMIMSNRAKLFCQVGINPENMEWSDLMHGFLSKSNVGFAGDYSKFDGIGDPQIYHSITQVVNNWYNDGEENATIRHALISSIIHREGIVKQYLFQYCQGMPSGFAMTVIFNSFVNYYYLAMAWMNLISSSPLSPQATLKDFDYYCKVVVYGDDNIVSVDQNFIKYYNLRMVAAYLSQFGVTYTDDAKNPIEKSVPFVDITSVSFLKRRWAPLGGRLSTIYKAPLDKTSIEERLHWIRECDDGIEALNQNIDSALYEASIHGPEYFGDLLARIQLACDAVMIPSPTVTYRDCQKRWWISMTGGALDPAGLSRLIKLADSSQVDPRSMLWKDAYLGERRNILDVLKTAKALPLAAYQV